MSPRTERVLRNRGALDDWVAHDWSDGLQIDTLADLDAVAVRTCNSMYELVVVAARSGEVLVRGGRYFPRFTRARLAGGTVGGSILKLLGIYVGLRMEFQLGRRRIVTSPVASIRLVPPATTQA